MQKLPAYAKQQPPHFHILEPIEDKDIGIDQVRELIYKLQNFAQQGEIRLFIFEELIV